MRIDYQGGTYEFEMAGITVKQAIKIEKYLGCPISDFGERLYPSEAGKPPDLMALQCLGWLILHGGKGIPIEDTDFPMTELTDAISASVLTGQAPAGTGETPVPTVAAAAVNGAAAADGLLVVP